MLENGVVSSTVVEQTSMVIASVGPVCQGQGWTQHKWRIWYWAADSTEMRPWMWLFVNSCKGKNQFLLPLNS